LQLSKIQAFAPLFAQRLHRKTSASVWASFSGDMVLRPTQSRNDRCGSARDFCRFCSKADWTAIQGRQPVSEK